MTLIDIKQILKTLKRSTSLIGFYHSLECSLTV